MDRQEKRELQKRNTVSFNNATQIASRVASLATRKTVKTIQDQLFYDEVLLRLDNSGGGAVLLDTIGGIQITGSSGAMGHPRTGWTDATLDISDLIAAVDYEHLVITAEQRETILDMDLGTVRPRFHFRIDQSRLNFGELRVVCGYEDDSIANYGLYISMKVIAPIDRPRAALYAQLAEAHVEQSWMIETVL